MLETLSEKTPCQTLRIEHDRLAMCFCLHFFTKVTAVTFVVPYQCTRVALHSQLGHHCQKRTITFSWYHLKGICYGSDPVAISLQLTNF